MALPPPGEAGPQDKMCFAPERLQRSPQHLDAYNMPFLPYVSVSHTVPPFTFWPAPPLLSSSLALQREPLYDLPWYGKLPPWYAIPHLPREVPHFNSSHEYRGATSGDLDHVGGQSDSGQCCGPEILMKPTAVNASLLPEVMKTPQLLPSFPGKRSEEGSKLPNPYGKSIPRYHFTQEDLHFVLFGVIPSVKHSAPLHHAISGFLVPTDSSGFDSLCRTLDKDSLQLPEGLCLKQTTFGELRHFGVFCSSLIAKGVRFGPFQGKVVNTSEVKTYGDNSLMWEIFEDGHLSHFTDGKGNAGNWMSFVNCAHFPKEQNLVAVQCQGQIFYESCKEICQNQELLVWYGDCYEKFLDIPVSLQVTEQGKQAPRSSEESAEGYRCERCGKVFTYKYYRDKHLKYTPCVDKGDRKFPCSLCKRSFEKRDRLRIHVLHSSSLNKHTRVHSGDRPYHCVYCTKRQHSREKPFKCKYCGKSFASAHAAHDSHVRRSHKEDKGWSCSICGKTFPNQEESYSHMKLHEGH
ncbi:unnamed protein product [Nyctereutes procyonoides]|uniref:(raccoon dog) hypothetical protein n=1 Tax=Nyctereutes procyonoides TaxID=34880 RepID=A0A811ZUV6_NYCPR|nr:unnamed protein product [Nyctereutes procyonoides]